jgi:hypothetical protein
VDTSLEGYVCDFDTSFSGNSLSYEINENQFLNSTGTTISEENLETDSTRYIEDRVELSEKILEKKSEFTQRTSTTGLIDAPIPKSIPIIQGLGALEFMKELENLKYSNEIKEFYKGSRELVKKLNIF